MHDQIVVLGIIAKKNTFFIYWTHLIQIIYWKITNGQKTRLFVYEMCWKNGNNVLIFFLFLHIKHTLSVSVTFSFFWMPQVTRCGPIDKKFSFVTSLLVTHFTEQKFLLMTILRVVRDNIVWFFTQKFVTIGCDCVCEKYLTNYRCCVSFTNVVIYL